MWNMEVKPERAAFISTLWGHHIQKKDIIFPIMTDIVEYWSGNREEFSKK